METKSIFLCGFMGAGKSTIGRELARKLGWRFLDTDSMIEEEHGPIPQIFSEKGEACFRRMEAELARKLCTEQYAVISTGGGFVLSDTVQDILKDAVVVYLDTDFEICYERISDSDRPLVRSRNKDQLYELYKTRDSIYRKVSAYQIPDNGSVKGTVDQIISRCI